MTLFRLLLLLVYFTIGRQARSTETMGPHPAHVREVDRDKMRTDKRWRSFAYIRNKCQEDPSTALCRHEKEPEELEVSFRQRWDVVTSKTPSSSPTPAPTIFKGAEGSGASSEPSSAPTRLGEDSSVEPSSSSSSPVGIEETFSPSKAPIVQEPSSQQASDTPAGPISTISSIAPSKVPVAQEPSGQQASDSPSGLPGVGTPISPTAPSIPPGVLEPSSQVIPTLLPPSILPPSINEVPSLSSLPSSSPEFQFPPSTPSLRPIGTPGMAPSDQLRSPESSSQRILPAFAWVLIVCIPLILILLIFIWWRQRVNKIKVMDNTRRESIQLHQMQLDSTFNSKTPISPIGPRSLLRPPSKVVADRALASDDDTRSDFGSSSAGGSSSLNTSEAESLLTRSIDGSKSQTELLPDVGSLSPIELDFDLPLETAAAASSTSSYSSETQPNLASEDGSKTEVLHDSSVGSLSPKELGLEPPPEASSIVSDSSENRPHFSSSSRGSSNRTNKSNIGELKSERGLSGEMKMPV